MDSEPPVSQWIVGFSEVSSALAAAWALPLVPRHSLLVSPYKPLCPGTRGGAFWEAIARPWFPGSGFLGTIRVDRGFEHWHLGTRGARLRSCAPAPAPAPAPVAAPFCAPPHCARAPLCLCAPAAACACGRWACVRLCLCAPWLTPRARAAWPPLAVVAAAPRRRLLWLLPLVVVAAPLLPASAPCRPGASAPSRPPRPLRAAARAAQFPFLYQNTAAWHTAHSRLFLTPTPHAQPLGRGSRTCPRSAPPG